MPYEVKNPRFFPGNISGLGMQQDDTGRKVDTRYGVVVSTLAGCLIEHPAPGAVTIALEASGTVGGTFDQVRALLLISPHVADDLVTELVEMLGRFDAAGVGRMLERLTRMIGHSSIMVVPSDDMEPVVVVAEATPAASRDVLVAPLLGGPQAA